MCTWLLPYVAAQLGTIDSGDSSSVSSCFFFSDNLKNPKRHNDTHLRCYVAGRSVQPARAEASIPRARQGRQTVVSQRCPKTDRKQTLRVMRICETSVDAGSKEQ